MTHGKQTNNYNNNNIKERKKERKWSLVGESQKFISSTKNLNVNLKGDSSQENTYEFMFQKQEKEAGLGRDSC